MITPDLWQCGKLSARKLGAGCGTGDVDTSNGDVFQLNADDGCLYEMPLSKHYVNTGYVNDGYVGNGQVICPNG